MVNFWQDYIHSYAAKYKLFIDTRARWKEEHAGFDTEEQYVASQRRLASEIQKIDDEVVERILNVFRRKHPEFKILAFDSGFANEDSECIGAVLVDDEDVKYMKDDLEQEFFQETEVNIRTDLLSRLPEQIKKRMKSNG